MLNANEEPDDIAVIRQLFERFSETSCDCLYINNGNSLMHNHR